MAAASMSTPAPPFGIGSFLVMSVPMAFVSNSKKPDSSVTPLLPFPLIRFRSKRLPEPNVPMCTNGTSPRTRMPSPEFGTAMVPVGSVPMKLPAITGSRM